MSIKPASGIVAPSNWDYVAGVIRKLLPDLEVIKKVNPCITNVHKFIIRFLFGFHGLVTCQRDDPVGDHEVFK